MILIPANPETKLQALLSVIPSLSLALLMNLVFFLGIALSDIKFTYRLTLLKTIIVQSILCGTEIKIWYDSYWNNSLTPEVKLLARISRSLFFFDCIFIALYFGLSAGSSSLKDKLLDVKPLLLGTIKSVVLVIIPYLVISHLFGKILAPLFFEYVSLGMSLFCTSVGVLMCLVTAVKLRDKDGGFVGFINSVFGRNNDKGFVTYAFSFVFLITVGQTIPEVLKFRKTEKWIYREEDILPLAVVMDITLLLFPFLYLIMESVRKSLAYCFRCNT